MLIFFLKTVHILGACLFFGTGLGSAWYKWRADRSGDMKIIAWCQKEIVLADWVFTVPSGIIMPSTGIALMYLYDYPWDAPWVLWGIAGYVLAGICWLPAAAYQIRMRNMAKESLESGKELSPEFYRLNRRWLVLGFPAFLASVGTIWLMVAKWASFGMGN